MEPFRKTINGIDFAFDMQGGQEEFYYVVTAENMAFEMHIDDNGMWKIKGIVKSWVKELEDDLGLAIEAANN